MTKYKIIVNPIAGNGKAGKLSPKIEEVFSQSGANFDIVHTETPWHAAALTQQAVACGYDVIASVGGDGTANEVLNGLLISKDHELGEARMGIIPIGRGNDFAFSMGAPVNWREACQAILEGHTRWIDVGRVWGGLYPEGRYFGNGVGIGFDAVVGFESQKYKFLGGFPSYIVAAIKTISLYYNSPMVEITIDHDKFEQPALMVSIMNGIRMGGGFMMAPTSLVDDGLLNLCIAGKVSRTEMLRLMSMFMKGTQGEHPAIGNHQSSSVVVRALDGLLPAHADGETLSTQATELRIQLKSRQIQLIIKNNP